MRAPVVMLTLAACSFHHGAPPGDTSPDGATSPSSWLAGYPYRKPIAIDAGVALAGFPVSVLIANDPDLAAHATDGRDFAFTAGDGVTVIPSEIVGWSAAGDLDAWIRIDVPITGTTAFLYYGGSAMPPAGDVWAGYAGVWHMSGTATEVDSTANHDDASAQNAPATPAPTPGVIGGACAYDGTNSSLSAGDPANGALDVGSGAFSVELWVNAQLSNIAYATPLWKGGSSTPAPGFDVELGDGTWHAEVVDAGGQLVWSSLGDQSTNANRWVQIVAVRTATEWQTFVDGAMVDQQSIVGIGSLDNNYDFEIGRIGPLFAGGIDEVRLIKQPLDANWIAAEYANAAKRASFVTVGAEQAR